MKRPLLRNLSLTCNLLLTTPNPNSSSAVFVSSTRSRLRLYSSDSDSSSEANFAQTPKRLGSVEDVDTITNQELKRRIEKYYEGDGEAIPSIFEAILMRKLAGNNNDDNKLREELGLQSTSEDTEDEEKGFDSDSAE